MRALYVMTNKRQHQYWTWIGFVLSTILAMVITTEVQAGMNLAREIPQNLPKKSCSQTFADVFEKISPSVVSIVGASVSFDRSEERVKRQVGSGLVINAKGHMLTNAHLVLGQQILTVILDDGTTYQAEVIGIDPIYDIALLTLSTLPERLLPMIPLHNSKGVRVGDEVIAIGNSMGLGKTLSRGSISAINRVLPELPSSVQLPFLQTDTPINPGNSGGPLVNRCGHVIGLATAVMIDSQNIGFAIPSTLIQSILPSLVKNGRVIRPWLGFRGQLVTQELVDLLRIPLVKGLLVEVVETGSPAEKSGLEGGETEVAVDGRGYIIGGDIVTKINDKSVTTPDALLNATKGLTVGAKMKLSIFRSGESRTVSYNLTERPYIPMDLPVDSD